MKEGMLIVYEGLDPEREIPSLGLLLRNAGHGRKGCIIDLVGSSSGEEHWSAQLNGDMVEVFPVNEDPFAAEDAGSFTVSVILRGSYHVVVLRGLPEAVASGRVSEQDMLHCLSTIPREVNVIVVGHNVPQSVIDLADVVTEVRDIRPSHPQPTTRTR